MKRRGQHEQSRVGIGVSGVSSLHGPGMPRGFQPVAGGRTPTDPDVASSKQRGSHIHYSGGPTICANVTTMGRSLSSDLCTVVRSRLVPIQASGSQVFVACSVR